MPSDLIVVIRSAGERTTQACQEAVSAQLTENGRVYEVTDVPFEEAHIRSVKLAVGSNATWAIFLDADVLLREHAIAMMLAEAESLAEPFYLLNFRVLDFGFAGPAYGVHLYNVKYLTQALEFEVIARKDQRPENRMVLEMREKNHVNSALSCNLVGLHGYEQYYCDLYRTSYVRAVKFQKRRDYLLTTLRSRCFRGCEYDLEYQVMMWGWLDGSVYGMQHEKAPLDKSFYQKNAAQMSTVLGLREKDEYMHDAGKVEETIQNHVTDVLYDANQYWICPSKIIIPPPSNRSLAKRLYRGMGQLIRSIAGR